MNSGNGGQKTFIFTFTPFVFFQVYLEIFVALVAGLVAFLKSGSLCRRSCGICASFSQIRRRTSLPKAIPFLFHIQDIGK